MSILLQRQNAGRGLLNSEIPFRLYISKFQQAGKRLHCLKDKASFNLIAARADRSKAIGKAGTRRRPCTAFSRG